jgi:hypothetical protein
MMTSTTIYLSDAILQNNDDMPIRLMLMSVLDGAWCANQAQMVRSSSVSIRARRGESMHARGFINVRFINICNEMDK